MLKQINGRGYMTGTSEGSLYPVVLTHPNGVTIGARLDLQKTDKPSILLVGIYARVEKYVGEVLVPMTTEEMFAAVPHLHFRIASPTHISGSLGGGAFQINPEDDNKTNAMKFGKLFHDSIAKLGTKLGLHRASDDDLMFFGEEAYLSKIVGQADEAKIEQQIEQQAEANAPMLDISSLTAKFGPLPKPE